MTLENFAMEKMKEELKYLIDQGLYESAEILGNFVLSTLDEHSEFSSFLRTEIQVLVADAIFSMKEFKRALNTYKRAQSMTKSFKSTKVNSNSHSNSVSNAKNTPRRGTNMNKVKLESFNAHSLNASPDFANRRTNRNRAEYLNLNLNSNSNLNLNSSVNMHTTEAINSNVIRNSPEVSTRHVSKMASTSDGSNSSTSANNFDINIKIKIAECHIALKDTKLAINELESIPAKFRSLKINFLLSKLYAKSGFTRPSVSAHKECLRNCPYAIESMIALSNLGINFSEIQIYFPQILKQKLSKTVDEFPDYINWMPKFIMAKCMSTEHDYEGALQLLKILILKFPENLFLQIEIARIESILDRVDDSIHSFKKARAIDPDNLKAMDEFAIVLSKKSKFVTLIESNLELNKLKTDALSTNLHAYETWLISSIFWKSRKELEKAKNCLDKAQWIDDQKWTLDFVKGMLALQTQNYDVAVTSFRRSLSFKINLDSYHDLITSYLSSGKAKEAFSLLKEILKYFPSFPVALSIVANIYSSHKDGKNKAKKYFESALKLDKNCLDAILGLSELHFQQKQISSAIELLENYLSNNSNDLAYIKLAEIFIAIGRLEDALSSFQSALHKNPENATAKLGLIRVENLMKGIDPDNAETGANEEGNHENDEQEFLG